MNNLALSIISAILMGLGATLTFNLWALFLKHAFSITPSNICLVRRWLRYMSDGIFRHSNIGSAPQKSAECTVGWIAHYMIGITFAIYCIRNSSNDPLFLLCLVRFAETWTQRLVAENTQKIIDKPWLDLFGCD